ncbi:hypothetical protein EV385_5130 [Krasilnikovia cinnamomea]|uniref:Alpha/beta hydrolase n=1 Tax=Krasilnikovia cinnamomea TaxID=349313 RepID=A0A4Q7ZQ57_9ACTN|nr:hypothetical protein EV385_5130 [Krasilnikovia cinnamomea]
MTIGRQPSGRCGDQGSRQKGIESLCPSGCSVLPFGFGLLADRLVGIIDWLRDQPATAILPLGLFGASTGAAAALLIVGERDTQVCELNEQARNTMLVSAELRVIPTATHLFEEPGTLQQVAEQAGRWFADYLTAPDVRL